ncbi:hypothetical protein [uncultured Cellulomonas sp.]|uniref:hypothetical protein n=1 Tax=uncultured Cellulomonas sp. TaxID=189682 RepID=UPI00260DA95C|nr:hypothetical protein [uncultured Cellulomonas sp.]
MNSSASPSSHFWSALRRFWWVVLGVTVLTAMAAEAAAPFAPAPEYTAQGRFLVPVRTVQDPDSPLRNTSPNDAQLLARTYAEILPTDPVILDSIAQQSGAPVGEVASAMSVEAISNTGVVEVSFTGTDEERVRTFFTSLNTALATGVTANIPVPNLLLLQDAQVTEEAGLDVSNRTVGIVAGLLLGLAAAMLLERLDSRVRSAADVRSLTDLPVIDLSRSRKPVAADVLALRALRLAPDVKEVAVVATDGPSNGISADLAERLRAANQNLVRSSSPAGHVPAAAWTPCGVLGSGNEGELGAQRADATVLVMTTGTRLRAADRAVVRLRALGISTVAIALTPSPRRWARANPGAAADAAPVEAAEDAQPQTPTHDLAARP